MKMTKFLLAAAIFLLLTASTPESRESNIRAAERGIRLLPYEVAIVFDHSGRELFRWSGDDHHVAIPDAALGSMKDDILTHNHPSRNWTFSADDLGVAWRVNLAQLRVVSFDDKHRATLCVFDRGRRQDWPPMLAPHWGFSGPLAEVSGAYDAVWRRWAAFNHLVYFCQVDRL